MNATKPPIDTELTPRHPHVIQAFHNWIEENGLTTHLQFVYLPDVRFDLPPVVGQLSPIVEADGMLASASLHHTYNIVNIARRAVSGLQFGDYGISGSMRSNGRKIDFYIPYRAIMNIYSRETRTIKDDSGKEYSIPLISNPLPMSLETLKEITDNAGDIPENPEAKKEEKTSAKDRAPFLKVVK